MTGIATAAGARAGDNLTKHPLATRPIREHACVTSPGGESRADAAGSIDTLVGGNIRECP